MELARIIMMYKNHGLKIGRVKKLKKGWLPVIWFDWGRINGRTDNT